MAIVFAATAHAGQLDKGGKPYIWHPIEVSKSFPSDTMEATVSVLHDVLEDTDVSVENLVGAFGQDVTAHVVHMSHRPGERYDDYIIRVGNCLMCTRIKLADLRHNMDVSRLVHPNERDVERQIKYVRAYERLMSVLQIRGGE